jgi:subtilisin family serine protease
MTDQGTGEGVRRREVLKGLAGAGAVGSGVVTTDRGFASGIDGDRYLVGIDPDASSAADAKATAKSNALSVRREIDLGTVRYVITGWYDSERLTQLRDHPAVAYVEQEGYFEPLTTGVDPAPNDHGAYPWGIERIGADAAHDSDYTGVGTDIAIIDTGVTPSHYALEGNIGAGNAFGDGACVEDDRAYNTVTCEQPWDDDQYHGTHVAGTAGAADAAVRPTVEPTGVLVSETADKDVVTGQKIRDDSLGVDANVVTANGENVVVNSGNVETESGTNVETEFGVDVIESENGHIVADEGTAGYTVFSDGNTIRSYTDNGDTTVNVQTADDVDVVPESVPDGSVDRIAGVAPEATLHAANVFEWREQNGEWALLAPWSNVADAVKWATDQGHDVINASLGGSIGSSTIKDALEYAVGQNNVVFVAAAGNDGENCDNDDCVGYPAAYSEAVAVASTNSSDGVASYSSRGPEVEVAAPGSSVLSTAPLHVKDERFPDLQYWKLSGTSMASPHVAGLAALLTAHTDLTDNTKIRELIAQTAEDIGGSDVETGSGLVDTQAALSNAQEPVAVSTSGSSAVTDAEATLTGDLTSLGDSSEADVSFEYREQGNTTWQETSRSTQTTTGSFEATVSGLAEGTTYEFRAAAVGGGVGDTGETQTFTTIDPLSVLTDGISAVQTQRTTLQGTLDSLGEANTVAAAFEYREQGNTEWVETLAQTLDQPATYEIEVDGLTPETTYEFRALAIADQDEDRGQTATVTTEQPLTVTTTDVVGIDRDGATLRGQLDALGDADSADVFFEYRQDGNAWTETDRKARTSSGEFEVTVTGLDAETTYEFRASAVTAQNTATAGTQTFTTEVLPLSVESRKPSGIGPTEATLQADVTQLGDASSVDVFFEYGPDGESPEQTTVTTVDSASIVETTVTELAPETTYVYTAVAETSNDTDTAEEVTFETAPPPLSVQTTGADDIGQRSATLQGELEETGGADSVSVSFEYGEASTDDRRETLAKTRQSSGSYEIAVDGLTPETTYAFQAVATTGEDTATGAEQTVTTAAPPLSVETLDPIGVGQTEATVRAELTELGGADTADVSIEFGPEGGDPETIAVFTRESPDTVEATVTELDPETTYVYTAVAETSDETDTGAEVTFETDPLPLSVETTDATEVGQETATLRGELEETGGANTVSATFEYWVEGTDDRQETLAKTLQSAGSYEIAVDGLSPETTYAFRALATSDRETDEGQTETFTTDAPPLAVETVGVSSVGEREATVTGGLLELGAADEADVYFEYWVEGESERAETDRREPDQPQSFEATLTELDPETTYQVRAVAETPVETATGDTLSFTTDALPLTVETGTATAVGQTAATLRGEVSELGESDAVGVVFEYWPVHGDEEGDETAAQVIEEPGLVEVELSDLMQDTTYEFQVRADGDGESDTGGISQLRTAVEPVDRMTVDTTTAESAAFSQRGEGYRIRAAGQTPWDRPRDRHGYGALYEEIEGDVVVQTSIEGLYGDHDVRMAGIVVSNDLLGHGGVDGDLLLTAEPDAGVSLVAYDAAERRYETVAADGFELPGDVRLTKSGQTFTAAIRTSEETEWTTLGTVTASAAEQTQEIGLFATGGHDSSRAIADFGAFQTGETGVSLLPSEWTLPPDRAATFDLVVENANRGVQSYTADVAVSDVTVGRIDEITLTGDPVEATIDIREDSSRATLAASLGDHPLDPGDAKIAEVTVETQKEGAVEVTLPETAVIGSETAVPYDITATQTADITVEGESGPPPVIGDDPPQDVDGDGLYEDINGDGRFTVADVSALFEVRGTDAVKNNAEFFNFDGSSAAKVTLGDVVALSEKLSGTDAEAAAILGVDPEDLRDGSVDPDDVSIRESAGSDEKLQR